MRSELAYLGILLSLTLLGHLVQDFLPPLVWAYQAQLYVVWALFFTVAVSVPYPAMLGFAFVNGILWEARHNVLADPDLSLTFGYMIVLLGLMGTFMQGIRPMFRRGRWELPVVMTGIATFFLLLIDFLLINLRRGGFYFPREIWFMVGTSGLLAMLISPLFLYLVNLLAKSTGYRVRYEGLYKRKASSAP